MINIVNGNILNAKEDIIVHQVNTQGVMGGGVAKQLALQYPRLEKEYSEHCKYLNNDYEKLKGNVLFYKHNNKIVCNMFSQKPNFDTDYNSMKTALTYIRAWAENRSLSVCMPYKIGCGIANGDWNIVYKIIGEVFSSYEVTLYRLEV